MKISNETVLIWFGVILFLLSLGWASFIEYFVMSPVFGNNLPPKWTIGDRILQWAPALCSAVLLAVGLWLQKRTR